MLIFDTKRSILFMTALLSFIPAGAGEAMKAEESHTERLRYANRPDTLLPYARVEIYKDLFVNRPEFRGSGRLLPDPVVDSVKIGFIGPLVSEDQPLIPENFRPGVSEGPKTLFGRHLLRGATLAVEEGNPDGGYKGIPFEIIRRTDLVQWGQTSNELAKFAYEDKVWAIVSSVDSNHSHVLSRAALKAQVPLINAGSTDPTLTEHTIPWLIRCMSDDRLNSYELLNYLTRVKQFTRIALLRVNDRDGRVGVREFMKNARRSGTPVKLELRFENGDTDFSSQLEEIRQLNPEAVVLWANPVEASLIVRQMRESGMDQVVVGFDRMSHPIFLARAGAAAEGVVVASTMNPTRSDPEWTEFRERYMNRFGEEPDVYAAHGYDAMQIIINAIRKAGLNRVRIRDELYRLDYYRGVTGPILFDQTMNDVGRPWLAEVKNGRFEYFRPADWPRKNTFSVQLESEIR